MDPPLWSVSVEIHFYMLLPFLSMFLAWISPNNMRIAVIFLLATGIASFLVHVWFVVPQNADPLDLPGSGPLAKSLPGKWFFFVPGLLVALLRVKWMQGTPKWLKGPLAYANTWMLIAWGLSFLRVINWRWSNPIPHMPGVAIGVVPDFCIIFFFAIGAMALPLKQGVFVTWLDWRPFALMGVVSYSFYVWHRVIIDQFVNRTPWPYFELIAVTLPLALLTAILSYRFIEAPFLRMRRRWSDAAATQQRKGSEKPAKPVAPNPEPAPS
jgi:peptidoglycan/LPS O-acetylase OafA/YrhL